MSELICDSCKNIITSNLQIIIRGINAAIDIIAVTNDPNIHVCKFCIIKTICDAFKENENRSLLVIQPYKLKG